MEDSVKIPTRILSVDNWNITSPTDVTNNGDSVTTLITGDWRAFALFQADPSEPDFLDKIYEIKWTSPLPGASSYDNTGTHIKINTLVSS